MNFVSRQRKLGAIATLMAGLSLGCASPAMYRPAVTKLTAATNVVIESSEHILDEGRRAQQESAILEIALYATERNGNVEVPELLPESEIKQLNKKQLFVVNGELYRPDVNALGAATAFDETQLGARKELFTTLKRTNELLNKIVTEDYSDQASKELTAIQKKLGSIKGFKPTEDGGKAIVALSFILKNVIEQRQAAAARQALLDLTADSIVDDKGTKMDGPLKAIVSLLRTDILDNYSKSILLPSVNSISQARKKYLISRFCSSNPVARQMALKEFLQSQDDVLAKYEMHAKYSRALKNLEDSLPDIHQAAESPDFLLIIQHLESFFGEAVQLKAALEKSEEAGKTK